MDTPTLRHSHGPTPRRGRGRHAPVTRQRIRTARQRHQTLGRDGHLFLIENGARVARRGALAGPAGPHDGGGRCEERGVTVTRADGAGHDGAVGCSRTRPGGGPGCGQRHSGRGSTRAARDTPRPGGRYGIQYNVSPHISPANAKKISPPSHWKSGSDFWSGRVQHSPLALLSSMRAFKRP